MDGVMNWVQANWTLLVPLVLGAIAVGAMLPRGGRSRWPGAIIGLAALVAAGFLLIRPSGEWIHDGLFYLFAGAAVLSGVQMITNHNPVYSALWFALTTLSVCGLFLLRSAPFLAAATVVVYAGAIIVTFLFVIMLARQANIASYDSNAVQPVMATVAAFLLLGGLLYTLQDWRTQGEAGLVVATAEANPLSKPAPEQYGTLRGLGRSMFGDYLFAVELAGTLLLVAAIGAIAIAPRRPQGTL